MFSLVVWGGGGSGRGGERGREEGRAFKYAVSRGGGWARATGTRKEGGGKKQGSLLSMGARSMYCCSSHSLSSGVLVALSSGGCR